jgi:hypothetical protein
MFDNAASDVPKDTGHDSESLVYFNTKVSMELMRLNLDKHAN